MKRVKIPDILKTTQALAWVGPEARGHLEEDSELVICSAREMLVQKVEELESMYIVISGSIQAMKGVKESERLLQIYQEGTVIGLNELFGIKVDAGVMLVAQTESLLLSFPKDKFTSTVLNAADTKDTYNMLRDSYDAYHFIRYSTYLGEILEPLFLIEFVSAFEKKLYQDSNIVFEQGDDPDGFYLCSKGKVNVSVVHDGNEVFNANLQAGDYFGELALTTDSKRSGTLSSIGESSCYFLSKESFNNLVKMEPRLLEGFQLLAKLAYG